jgi:hypothetical protein
MSNFIKVPLAINPARSLVTGTGSLTASITTNSSDATDASVATVAFTTSGTGTGATVQLTIASNAVSVASCTVEGEGFKVGDTLTFASSVIGGTTDVVIKLVADDLVAVEGSATNEYALIPIDNVACVSGVSTTACDIQILENNFATPTSGTGEVTKYTITVDDVPATTKAALQADVAAAIIKAAGAENAQPEVKFTNGAECLTVVLS